MKLWPTYFSDTIMTKELIVAESIRQKDKYCVKKKSSLTSKEHEVIGLLFGSLFLTALFVFYLYVELTSRGGNNTHPIFKAPYEVLTQYEFKEKLSQAPSCNVSLRKVDIRFTLVTQLSDDRLWLLKHHCERWRGEMSIAIFTNMDFEHLQQEIGSMSALCNLDTMNIQTYSKINIADSDYPINELRNIAIQAVKTSHILFVDIDFLPSYNAYDVLHSAQVVEAFSSNPMIAMVVPAFALERQCAEEEECEALNMSVVPTNMSDLLSEFIKNTVFPFGFDRSNTQGQDSTLYDKWFQQVEGTLLSLNCIRSNRYEPFLAYRYCDALPPFQDQFTGYGKNKMTQIMQMRRVGYYFFQIGGVFLTHFPHHISMSRKLWDGGLWKPEIIKKAKGKPVDFLIYKRGQNDLIYVEFKKWLTEKIPDSTRVPICDEFKDDDSELWIS